MTENRPSKSREHVAIGHRLRHAAADIRMPLPDAVKHRVMSQLDAPPTLRGKHVAVRVRRPLRWGGGLAAATVALVLMVQWLALDPAPSERPPVVVDAATDWPPSFSDHLPTWEVMALVDEPWRQEAQHLLDDTRNLGRFLLTRADVPDPF